MRVLALNKSRGYATLLFDVAPGTHFPPHHHGGAEECYVVSGSPVHRAVGVWTRGDFVHADADTDHGELSPKRVARSSWSFRLKKPLPPEMLA
jgi:anti-sigma factor ChrR (cupin superfamily)